jgi:hypothetical protein
MRPGNKGEDRQLHHSQRRRCCVAEGVALELHLRVDHN